LFQECGGFSADRRYPVFLKNKLWGKLMLRTISLGSCVSVQGMVVGQLSDGKVIVRVDEKTFVGYP
jgi:hypothetical protein